MKAWVNWKTSFVLNSKSITVCFPPLTVGDDVSQLTHWANRCFASHTCNTGSASALFSSCPSSSTTPSISLFSFRVSPRQSMWGWTSLCLLFSQKQTRMAMNAFHLEDTEDRSIKKGDSFTDKHDIYRQQNNPTALVMNMFFLIGKPLALYRNTVQ